VLPKVVVPVGAAVEFAVGAAATATVKVFVDTKDRFPAASTTYNLYVPATKPAVDIAVSVFAVAIVTELKLLSAAPVILARFVTVTVSLTKYAVPVSLDLTVTPLDVVTLTVATVGVGAVASTVIDSAADVVALPAASVSVTVIDQTPSPSVPSVHALLEIVHVTLVDPAFVAVTTAVPENVPDTLIVGVLSLVTLSDVELPVSEAVSRSGVDGVATVVLLITTPVSAVEALDVTLL
jgi:hypothetical protein